MGFFDELKDFLTNQANKSAKTKKNRTVSNSNNKRKNTSTKKKNTQTKRGPVVIAGPKNKNTNKNTNKNKKNAPDKKQTVQRTTGAERQKELLEKRKQATSNSRRRQARQEASEQAKKNLQEVIKETTGNGREVKEKLKPDEREYKGANAKSMNATRNRNKQRRDAIPKAQEEIAERPAVLGFYNAANPLPVDIDEHFATKEARDKAKESKDTTAYKVSYGVTTAGGFLTGAGAGNAVTKNVLKNTAKAGAKKAVKRGPVQIARAKGKNVVKTTGKATIKKAPENTKAQKFVAGRVGDFVGSTPLNLKEAVKEGRQEDGSFDEKKAVESFAKNTALDFAVGGALEGAIAGAKVLKTKADANKFIKIKAKKDAGGKLTAEEQRFYTKAMGELQDDYVNKAGQKAVEEVRAKYDEPKKNIENTQKSETISTKSATGVDEIEVPKTAETKVEIPKTEEPKTAEQIKTNNPDPKKAVKDSERIKPEEVPRAKQTAVKLANQVDDDVAEIVEPWVREGYADKKVLQSQEQALEKATKELEDGRLYQNFMDSKVETDEHEFMARAQVLLTDLMKKAPESDEAADMLLKVMDKATEASSHAGRLLNATKLLLRNTPQGRVRTISKEVDRLNTKFADRLGGKKIELSEDQVNRILNATDDTIEDVAEQINKEVWDEIPATWFEKWNEIRHTSMLFNAKTHARNLLGNTVFYQGRLMSDSLEIVAYKIPAVRKRLENLGGKVDMVHVTRKELADNKEQLNKIFNENYKKSNSKNRYIESTRPDNSPIIKNKVGNKVVQTNYGLLEQEDLIAFRPEYKKSYIRWCKANDIPLDKLDSMTKKQKLQADAYAMKKAEYATFRDDSAFATKIVGLKQKTAGAKGKTVIGTAGYRAGNVALESMLPFVKTPVNILRRSVDYSPVGLLRGCVELSTAKTADNFMQGVHRMATGLTGTGIFALGAYLANKDLIMVKAGETSGDAYYDRDMGYQDHSLVLKFGDKEYSLTIDWLSPMQTSLFMGATAYNNMSEDGLSFVDICDSLVAMTGPMLDMSFMSTAKDTIEMFTEKAYRQGESDEPDWSGAVVKTLFGSIPQGYLNSFVPQIVSQTAQAMDSKQRDTRSTKEDPISSSWDSWGKKMINKIPVLRNKVLNPKLDRFGNDVETGNNIVTRLLNAYVNPSNTKEIKLTEMDKELIKIYNKLDDEEKKYFFYNFTGNPSYDLGDGKRMNYNELYKYGKEKRIQQTKLIEKMINSASYKNMTWQMKGDEVSKDHWISQTYADRKVYGDTYAAEKAVENSDTEKQAREEFLLMGGTDKSFVNAYLKKEETVNRCHDTSYNTKAIALVGMNDDRIMKAYGVWGEKAELAKEYFKKGGSTKEYSNAMCNVISKITSEEASVSYPNKAVAAAYYDINNRTKKAMGLDNQLANMGIGLKKFNYTLNSLKQVKVQALYEFDKDANNRLKKEEIVNYIESLGITDTVEKACLFRYFSSANNPYGDIPNFANMEYDDSNGSGSYSGRSRGSRSSGGSSSGTEQTWEEYLDDVFGKDRSKLKTSPVSSNKSALNDAYRKKVGKLVGNMRV